MPVKFQQGDLSLTIISNLEWIHFHTSISVEAFRVSHCAPIVDMFAAGTVDLNKWLVVLSQLGHYFLLLWWWPLSHSSSLISWPFSGQQILDLLSACLMGTIAITTWSRWPMAFSSKFLGTFNDTRNPVKYLFVVLHNHTHLDLGMMRMLNNYSCSHGTSTTQHGMASLIAIAINCNCTTATDNSENLRKLHLWKTSLSVYHSIKAQFMSVGKFWEAQQMQDAWKDNMAELLYPAWVVCLDESMSFWYRQWTCPGLCFAWGSHILWATGTTPSAVPSLASC